MTQVEYIKDLYEKEGMSLREISRQTGKDFRTVQKYAYCDNWNPSVKLTFGAFTDISAALPHAIGWII